MSNLPKAGSTGAARSSPEYTPSIHLELLPSDEVKPCPFCGGAPELCNTHSACYWLECECGIEAHGRAYGHNLTSDKQTLGHHQKAKASALATWNRRTP